MEFMTSAINGYGQHTYDRCDDAVGTKRQRIGVNDKMSSLPNTMHKNIYSFLYFLELQPLTLCNIGINRQVSPLHLCADYAKKHGYPSLIHFLMKQWLRVRTSPVDLVHMRSAFQHFILNEDSHHLQWFIFQLVRWDQYSDQYKEFLRWDCETFANLLKTWIGTVYENGSKKALLTLYIGKESIGAGPPREKLSYFYSELDEQLEDGFDIDLISLLVLAYRAAEFVNESRIFIRIIEKIEIDLHAAKKAQRDIAMKALKIFLDKAATCPGLCLDAFFGVFAKAHALTLDRLISCCSGMIHLDLRLLEFLTLSHMEKIADNCPDLQTLQFQENSVLTMDKVKGIMLAKRPKAALPLKILGGSLPLPKSQLLLSPAAPHTS